MLTGPMPAPSTTSRRSLSKLALLLAVGCARPVPAPAAPRDVEQRAAALTAALARGDLAAVAAEVAVDGELRVEIRQVLTETDERDTHTLRGRAEVLQWLAGLAQDLDGTRADARWPRGVYPGSGWLRLSACVDARDRSVPEGTLALRRLCFSDTRTEPPSLAYLVLAEAK